MNTQRHIIKRQVIEVTIRGGGAKAQAIQDELSRIYRQRIIPLLDRRCSELSAPDRLYRIETLDLDLGKLDLHSLEGDFVAKVDAVLSRELAAQIQTQEQAARHSSGSSATNSHLELFVYFVRTGSMPWWVDVSRTGLLQENLTTLLAESPQALARELKKWLPASPIRQRIINHYNDRQLTSLCGLLVPDYQAALGRDFHELQDGLAADSGRQQQRRRDFHELQDGLAADSGRQQQLRRNFHELQDGLAADSIQRQKLRQTLWDNILMTAAMGGQQYGTVAAFYQAVLKRVAAALGRATLLADFRQAIQSGRIKVNNQLAGIIAKANETDTGMQTSLGQALMMRLTQLQAGGGPLSTALAGLKKLLTQLPAPSRSALLDALHHLPAGASVQSIALCILQALETGSLRQHDRGGDISRVMTLCRTIADNFTDHGQRDSQISDKNTIDLRFSRADEYPVTNAGLVILWPFLGHFFRLVGLFDEEHHFRDLAARQRAAGLLQVVATRDASPPEYLLPLNKMLCGLDGETVFDFGPPLSEDEAQECENLLLAVIAQAPVLRDMTPDGFRGSFLLRPGILGSRDGMGLLRVERQTYDIVLDRFPWSWEWVKLSWMEAPLRVEW